jgi:hypothetical protein
MDIKNFFYLGGNNFGDSINSVFFDLLADRKFNYSKHPKSLHYLGTGSVLRHCTEKSILVGTGFIDQDDDLGMGGKKISDKVYQIPADIILVRGPKTREKFLHHGIDCPPNYGDPILLFPVVYYNSAIKEIPNKVGFLPHYIDKGTKTSNSLINDLNTRGYTVEQINILTGKAYKELINSILSSEIIITSSLHGVILGIAYKKKVIFTELSRNVIGNRFKFNDFFESVDAKNCNPLPPGQDPQDYFIKYDPNNLKSIGLKMIELYPFIEKGRKQILSDKWSAHWS